MRSRKSILGAVLALAVSLTVFQSGGPGVANPPGEAGRPIPAKTSAHAVTLVTGDVVTVLAGERLTLAGVKPAKGRERISFVVSQAGGHLRVIPRDALAALGAGQLDERLFDVSTLLEFGYDDRRKDLPLIVIGGQAPMNKANSARPVPGGTALRVSKADLAGLWPGLASAKSRSAGKTKVWLDGLRKPVLDRSVAQIKAPEAWQAGYTGTGVKVAVVDTGIDVTHPDLAGQVIAARDFVGDGHDLDVVGHGTHVAATIASKGSPYKGVAPGAQLVSAKVCLLFGCPESAILEGMQWAAEQGAKVINMSLGGADGPELDPIEAAVQDLTARYGALFVVSAGNAGADESVGSPGSADAALTVGAVDRDDSLAPFSSRGPRAGDGALKPDITAPGVRIVAAQSKDAQLGNPGDAHLSLSGTSMASPHVAGAAAILAQQHPTWSPGDLKSALMGSALANPDLPVYAQGSGRVDVGSAIGQQVLADPPSVSFGRQAWPHDDDQIQTRTVSYTNRGSAAVTLELSLTGGPAGMFSLSAPTVTVPAGGTASVTISADTRVNVPDARYGGRLTARAGQTVVGTPFAVDKELERYDVSLVPLDRQGQPAQDSSTLLIDPVAGTIFDAFGAQTVRIPRGRYLVLSDVYEAQDITMLAEPEVVVDRDRTVVLDARVARPIAISLPMPDAAPQLFVASAVVRLPGGSGAFLAMADPGTTIHTGSSDPGKTSPNLTGLITAQYTAADVEPIDSPYVTEVAWHLPGRMFQGFEKRLGWRDLATVDVRYASQGSPLAWARFGPTWKDLPWTENPVNLASEIRLPSTRLEYHNADEAISWAPEMYELDWDQPIPFVGNALFSSPTRLAAGRRTSETRNQAVYGPGFGEPLTASGWVTRQGDTMTLLPTIVNDRLNWNGLPLTGDFRTTLDRNGQRILDEAVLGVQTEVPPGDAAYQLAVEMTRGGASSLSTKVSCVWTFRSTTTSAQKAVPLALSAVRFLPDLDLANTAPAGGIHVVPIQVQRQIGSSAGKVKKLTVYVSYDDGASWHKVQVVRFGQLGFIALNHPARPGFVSLRAELTDQHGNTLKQTIIRAYRIG